MDENWMLEHVDASNIYNCLKKRKALIAHELAWYNLDVTTICETWLAEVGQLKELSANDTYF